MTHPLENKALASFGRELIAYARDLTIELCDKSVAGEMAGEESARLRARLDALDPDARSLVHELIPQIVDRTLHNLMGMLSDEDHIAVSVTVDGETTPDINKVSDGLRVDLWYWIEAFSKQRHKSSQVTSPGEGGASMG